MRTGGEQPGLVGCEGGREMEGEGGRKGEREGEKEEKCTEMVFVLLFLTINSIITKIHDKRTISMKGVA